jgi:hypothetical protein
MPAGLPASAAAPRRLAAAELPYRGRFGDPRPVSLRELPLPPAAMPSHWGARPLKAWRYIGVYGPELMLCAAVARIGRARQTFWAVWDRLEQTLYERTVLGRGPVSLAPGRLRVRDGEVRIDLRLQEGAGVEAVCRSGRAFAWTRKQAGVVAAGAVELRGRRLALEALAVLDDTAAYYERHTRWRWCAGVGEASDGRALAWNLVAGVNDPPASSERTVWVEGEPREAAPCHFAADLSAVDGLRFSPEATRARSDNLLVVRSRYRQPFGTFSGELPGGITLAAGYGVIEEHEAWW